MVSKGFPNVITSGRQYNIGVKPSVILLVVVVVVFTLKSRSGLYSVLSNIRTGPTDADAFRGHRLTTQKGYTYQKEIKGPEKSTHTR